MQLELSLVIAPQEQDPLWQLFWMGVERRSEVEDDISQIVNDQLMTVCLSVLFCFSSRPAANSAEAIGQWRNMAHKPSRKPSKRHKIKHNSAIKKDSHHVLVYSCPPWHPYHSLRQGKRQDCRL